MNQQPFPNPGGFPPPIPYANYNYNWPAPPLSVPPPNFTSPPPPHNFNSPPPSPNFPCPLPRLSLPPPGYFPPGSPRNILPLNPTTVFKQSQQEQDKAWVKSWLDNRSKTISSKATCDQPVMKMKDIKQLVVSAKENVSQLKKYQELLQKNLVSESSVWNELVSKIEEIKEKLSLNMLTLKNSSHLQQIVKKRKCKRQAQHRRRVELKKERQSRQLATQELNLQIDEWMRQQQEEVEREKRDEYMKKEADAVLGEVRLKQSEGRRWVQLLTSLTKLRKLRAQAAAEKGLRPSESEDVEFNETIGKLLSTWNLRMDDYAAEEHALKVMLAEEAFAKHGFNKKNDKSRNPLEQWEKILFGPEPNVNDIEYAHHMRANTNFQELLNIRQKWDEMVVALAAPGITVMTSAPPVGWVVPTVASSENWDSLLEQQN
ncbi:hypothetical protein B566_EDAN011875 [Ephemera danica]|nr:hypothetical protein B566_EDAN011875 [Ephemera danica]